MGFKDLGRKEKEKLLAAYREFGDTVLREQADRFGLRVDTIRRYLNEFERVGGEYSERAPGELVAPESPTLPTVKPLLLRTADALVISDLEIPDHSSNLLDRAVRLAEVRQLGAWCIIAGDFLANDHFAGKHPPQRQQLSYDEVLDLAIAVLEFLLRYFDRVLIFEGNHDRRISKSTFGHVSMQRLLNVSQPDRLIYSPLAHCYVIPDNAAPIEINHPDNYSINPLTVAHALYANARGPFFPDELVKPHIMMAHTHSGVQGWSKDGWRKLLCLGTMREHAAYKDTHRNKYPEWVKGFGSIENGQPKLYNDDTDWDRELATAGLRPYQRTDSNGTVRDHHGKPDSNIIRFPTPYRLADWYGDRDT